MKLIETAQAGIIADAPRVPTLLLAVLNFLLSVAGIIAIIMIVVSGIRYLVAMGSEAEMKSAKGSAKNWTIGVVMIFGAMIIIRTVSSVLQAR